MKEIVSQPTNGVICEDGKIAKNGLRVICPFCGEIGLSQGRGGSVNVWTVGAIERRECTKCRKQFHTIALTVPPDMTPEDFYSAVRALALFLFLGKGDPQFRGARPAVTDFAEKRVLQSAATAPTGIRHLHFPPSFVHGGEGPPGPASGPVPGHTPGESSCPG